MFKGSASFLRREPFDYRTGWLLLRLRDNGRPFDLTEQYRLFDPGDRTSNIGLRLVFGSASDVSYSHSFGLNNVCIKMDIIGE